MRLRYLFVLMIAVVFLLAACENAQEFEAPGDIQDQSPNRNQAGQDDSQQDTQPDTQPSQQMSAREKVVDICKSRPDFKIEYEVNINMEGREQSIIQTIASKGDDYKQEISTDALYVVDNTVYDCRQNQTGWTCYQFPPSQEEPPSAEQLCSVPENVTVTSVDDKNIAGRSTECFQFRIQGAEVTEINCYTEDGIPLYSLQESEQQSVERTALQVSTSVPSSEFDLPVNEPIVLTEEDLQQSQNAQPR